MSKFVGVTIEKDTRGNATRVIFDVKYHKEFIEDYLDGLEAKERMKNAEYVSWDEVKTEMDKKHGIIRK